MFDIVALELENFRSYQGKHAFSLPNRPGLYLVTGLNEVEPRLGANACGKSTLLEAIYWCLYGRTTRGLKAGDVVTRGQKGCRASVVLNVAGEAFKVTRTQNPNSLTVDGVTVSQEALNKRLRIGPVAFTYAVMTPQFGSAFFDLGATDKLALFSQIMELEYWLERSKDAQLLAHEIELMLDSKNLSLNTVRGRIDILTADIEELGTKEATYANDQANLLKHYQSQLADISTNRAKTAEAIAFSKRARDNADGKIKRLLAQSRICCPTCKQAIEDQKVSKDLIALRQNRDDFERQIHRFVREEAVWAQSEVHSRSQLEAERARVNPYGEQLARKREAFKKAKAQQTVLGQGIDELMADYHATNFWVNGFKRLRLYVVETTLLKLEVEVNNNMTSLGLTDWRIAFDVERENKQGGITKGFVVLVYPPGCPEAVRYETWSGGETQRLRLAGDLGLANLIMERAGLNGAVEFYDEPSRHLSEEGLADVAETLHQRALDEGKRIFLVDHATLDFGEFAGKVFVTKDGKGSRLEYTA